MKILKRTKVVATIGPASTDEKVLARMITSGFNVARLNFSHGDFAEHQQRLDLIRATSEKLGIPVAILQDLGGPKIRTGDFQEGKITLKKGAIFTFTGEKIMGDETRCSISYPTLAEEIKKGNRIMINDGKQQLEVIATSGKEIRCRVIVGGVIKNRRGVNLPDVYLKKIKALTTKDKKDLEFGIKNEVDFVALSFVRSADDVKELRGLLTKNKLDAKIIAKIETPQAVANIESIVEETDAIMVARGDLAVEVPAEDVPLIQKRIIKLCRAKGKPVIVATQMLMSMTDSPRPTRAEVSDVANSILDGADAVMLSEETAMGEYPVEAIEVMTCVAQKTESMFPYRENQAFLDEKNILDSISFSVVKTAYEIRAKYIIALTESGLTSRMVSRFKPEQPILVFTPNERAARKMLLSYGCIPVVTKSFSDMLDVKHYSREFLKKNKLAKKGDRVVITAGIPFGREGGTNTLLADVLR